MPVYYPLIIKKTLDPDTGNNDMEEYIPENNLVVLLLLLFFSCGLYYFWWLARISHLFGDRAMTNIVLSVVTCGIWILYINMKYMQRSELMNGRDIKWYMVFFFPVAPLVVQHNINERYFSGR